MRCAHIWDTLSHVQRVFRTGSDAVRQPCSVNSSQKVCNVSYYKEMGTYCELYCGVFLFCFFSPKSNMTHVFKLHRTVGARDVKSGEWRVKCVY